jgi:hypothetical protein
MLRIMSFVIACSLAALIPLQQSPTVSNASELDFDGWPSEFNGEELFPIDEPDNEALAIRFDGKIGRFQFGHDNLVIRWVSKPSRSVHPAADCFRANGYKIHDEKLCSSKNNQLWRCFEVTRNNERFSVRERIFDKNGSAWTDTSSWYWAATLGKTEGPWWFYTVESKI